MGLQNKNNFEVGYIFLAKIPKIYQKISKYFLVLTQKLGQNYGKLPRKMWVLGENAKNNFVDHTSLQDRGG